MKLDFAVITVHKNKILKAQTSRTLVSSVFFVVILQHKINFISCSSSIVKFWIVLYCWGGIGVGVDEQAEPSMGRYMGAWVGAWVGAWLVMWWSCDGGGYNAHFYNGLFLKTLKFIKRTHFLVFYSN